VPREEVWPDGLVDRLDELGNRDTDSRAELALPPIPELPDETETGTTLVSTAGHPVTVTVVWRAGAVMVLAGTTPRQRQALR
jgi:hypothetical protein